MSRRTALAAALTLALWCPTYAWADGGVAVEQALPSGGYQIDVSATYTGGGAGNYGGNYGIGTMRVSLPGLDKTHPPTFAATAADPSSYTCAVVAGADGVDGTGFECSTRGTPNGNQTLLFPTDVTVHLVSPICYQFPPSDSKGAARADVWSAAFDPGLSPDATYTLSSDLTCPPAAPASPEQTPAASTQCVVPKLKGLTTTAATSKLKTAGCKLGAVKRSYSTKVKNGRVISQGTAAGTKVANGTAVRVTVSRGPKKKR